MHTVARHRVERVRFTPIEELMWAVEAKAPGSLRGVVVVWVDGTIHDECFAEALRRVQNRHPKLSAVVEVDDEGRHSFAFDSTAAPITCSIEDYDGEVPWREIGRRLMSAPFNPSGPFALAAVLRSRSSDKSVFMVAAHHAILDGQAGLVLADDLLTEYAAAEAGVSAGLPVLPAIQVGRARERSGWRGRLWLLRRFLSMRRSERRVPTIPLRAEPRGGAGAERQPQWEHWVLPANETKRLIQRCRRERASFSGALIAASCRALLDAASALQARFRIVVPFDVRDLLESDPPDLTTDQVGCYAAIMTMLVDGARQQSVWDFARTAENEMKAFSDRGGPSVVYNLSDIVAGKTFNRVAPRVIGDASRPTLMTTHYGAVRLRDRYGSLRPYACTLNFSNEQIGPWVVVEALVLGRELNVGIAAPYLDAGIWQRVLEAIKAQIAEMSAELPTGAPITP